MWHKCRSFVAVLVYINDMTFNFSYLHSYSFSLILNSLSHANKLPGLLYSQRKFLVLSFQYFSAMLDIEVVHRWCWYLFMKKETRVVWVAYTQKRKLLNLNKNHVNNFINIISNKIVIESFFSPSSSKHFFLAT